MNSAGKSRLVLFHSYRRAVIGIFFRSLLAIRIVKAPRHGSSDAQDQN